MAARVHAWSAPTNGSIWIARERGCALPHASEGCGHLHLCQTVLYGNCSGRYGIEFSLELYRGPLFEILPGSDLKNSHLPAGTESFSNPVRPNLKTPHYSALAGDISGTALIYTDTVRVEYTYLYMSNI